MSGTDSGVLYSRLNSCVTLYISEEESSVYPRTAVLFKYSFRYWVTRSLSFMRMKVSK